MQNTITKAMTDEASVMRLRQSIFNYYNGTRTDYPARSATLSFKNGTICDADGNMARVSGCIQMNGGAKPGAKELSRIRGGGMKMVGNRIVRGAQADYVLEFMDFDYAVYRLPEAATTPAPETPKGK